MTQTPLFAPSHRTKSDFWVMLGLFLLGALLHGLVAWPLQSPGYMDAYYYYNGGTALYQDQGFTEDYIWNYLDDPQALPRPSHLYWMPLPSVLVYLAFRLLGPGLHSVHLVGAFLSAILPVLCYMVSRQLGGARWQSILGAGLTLFSGFYLVYWAAPDSFALYGVVGAFCILVLAHSLSRPDWPFLALAGGLAGLAHLTRADGVLLLGLAVLLPWWMRLRDRRRGISGLSWRGALASSLAAVLGYLVVMAPWFWRNVQVMGRPLPAAGVQTLFLREYDDIFAYGRELSLQYYLDWGWGNIFRSKVDALWTNAQTVVASWLQIFPAPFVVVGLWKMRRHAVVQVAVLYGAVLFLTMSLAFTAPGPRGSLFHSGAALLPFLYAAAGVGLMAAVSWVHRWLKHWQPERASKVFGALFLLLSAALSAGLYVQSVWMGDGETGRAPWNERDALYREVDVWLTAHGEPADRIMIVNPPAFYYVSGRPCLAIPNETLDVVVEAARSYGVTYLLIERDHPEPLDSLYEGDGTEECLPKVAQWESALLFEVQDNCARQ